MCAFLTLNSKMGMNAQGEGLRVQREGMVPGTSLAQEAPVHAEHGAQPKDV